MSKVLRLVKHNLRESIIVIAMIVCIVPFTPLGSFRDDVTQRSKDVGHAFTDELEPGMSVTQYFVAKYSDLESIEFVVYYDGDVKDGNLLFELLDSDDNLLFVKEISYCYVENYTYDGVETDLKLKRFHTYKYRITNMDIVENVPKVVYETDRRKDAAPNRSMEFDGKVTEGNLLTRYVWNAPIAWYHVLSVAACIGVVGFTLMKLTKTEKKEKNIEVG
jgi:hypothetical protein